MVNPAHQHEDFILRFCRNASVLMFSAEEGKLPSMHVTRAEGILDTHDIQWEVDKLNQPYMAILLQGLVGTVVVWPFKLTGPLPQQVVADCSYDFLCRAPGGAQYTIYGGN